MVIEMEDARLHTSEKISEASLLRSSSSYWRDFRLSLWDSMRRTARRIAMTKSPYCWRSCVSRSPVPPPAVQRSCLGRIQERRGGAETVGGRAHPATVFQTGQHVLGGLPGPLCDLPSPVRLPGDHNGCHKKGVHALSLRGHEDAV
jgi:hypothetical protein